MSDSLERAKEIYKQSERTEQEDAGRNKISFVRFFETHGYSMIADALKKIIDDVWPDLYKWIKTILNKKNNN